jgi:hypothetical protein
MGMFHVLNETGDTKTIWDPKNDDEVEVAEEQFKKLVKKGYKAYKVGKDGEKSSPVSSFNKAYEKLIFVPPIAGG